MGTRRTWKKGNLYISFGRPSITPHNNEKPVKDMEDVCYFYYDIEIFNKNKSIFKADAYDFPKVQLLPLFIDELLNFDMSKAYLLENSKDGKIIRKVRYHQVIMEDLFNVEYEYKLERYDYELKERQDMDVELSTHYILTIGKLEACGTYGGANREDYGKSIVIKHLTEEDLIRLKETAEAFCHEAIKIHNRYLLQLQS